VIKIVKQWLTEHGYDGLVNPDAECGCSIDEICPWTDNHWGDCEPAYKVPADADFKANWGEDCEEMFSTKKVER